MLSIGLYDAAEALAIMDDLLAEHAEQIEAAGGDIEAVPAIAELLAFAEEQFESAVERIALAIRSFDAEAEAIKIEAVRLEVMARRKENVVKRLKHYLQRQLEGRGVKKVKSRLVSVRLQLNSQASVRALDDATIETLYAAGSPFAQRKMVYSLARDLILAAKENGEELPEGILVERGYHVRVE